MCKVPELNPKVSSIDIKFSSFEEKTSKYEHGIEREPRVVNSDGTVYAGEWKNNLPHGKGKMYFTDGSYYNGYFEQGIPQG